MMATDWELTLERDELREQVTALDARMVAILWQLKCATKALGDGMPPSAIAAAQKALERAAMIAGGMSEREMWSLTKGQEVLR